MLPCIAQSPFKDISLVRIQDECSQTQTPLNCNCPRLAIVLLRRSRLSMYFAAVLPVGNLNGLLPHWLNNKPKELIFLGRQLKEHMHVMHFAPHCRTNNSIWYVLTDYWPHVLVQNWPHDWSHDNPHDWPKLWCQARLLRCFVCFLAMINHLFSGGPSL